MGSDPIIPQAAVEAAQRARHEAATDGKSEEDIERAMLSAAAALIVGPLLARADAAEREVAELQALGDRQAKNNARLAEEVGRLRGLLGAKHEALERLDRLYRADCEQQDDGSVPRPAWLDAALKGEG